MVMRDFDTLWDRKTYISIKENFKELFNYYIKSGLDAAEAREKAIQAVADAEIAKETAETTREEMLAIIREQTQNGDLAPEIAQARQGKETLGENLNSIKSDLAQTEDDLEDRGINVKNYVTSFSDTTEAIRTAEKDAASQKKPLFFPKGHEFIVRDSIHIRENIDVIMHSPIVYAATDNKPALIIGTKGIVNYAEQLILNVKRQTVSDWQDENSIGIQLINCNNSQITVIQARGFSVGVEALGSGQGFTYCQLTLGALINNKVGLDITNESFDRKIGWSNESTYYGGRFSCLSNVGVGLSRIGVRIRSKDGTNLFNNNNTGYGQNFELNQNMAGEGEALPFLIEHGGNNRFYDYRDEGNGPVTARVTGRSRFNTFVVGFSELTKEPLVEDTTIYPSSVVEHSRDFVVTKDIARVIFSSGKLADIANIYNKDDGSAYIPGVSVGNTANAEIYKSRSTVLLKNDYIEVDGTSGIGVFIDTSNVKKFILNKETLLNSQGLTYIICYDEFGNVMREGTVPLIKTSSSSQPLTFDTSIYGGGYRNVTNENDISLFFVDESVKMVRIIMGRRSVGEPLRIKSFSVTAIGKGEVAAFSGLENEVIPGVPYAINPPDTGPRGKVIHNVNAAAGGYVGWTYTGASGTRKAFGLIEN